MLSQEELARKLTLLERRYDRQFEIVFDAAREIMAREAPPKRGRIGFRLEEVITLAVSCSGFHGEIANR